MRAQAAAAEDSRQVLHMAMGSFALLLPFLTWFQAVLCAGIALVFNLFLMERVAAGVFRPGERGHPAASGIILYPASVLMLLLVFHSRPDIVAAAWGVLAVGDGMATLVGTRMPIARLPWNQEKSVGGSLAMMVFGAAAASGLAWWCRDIVIPPPYWWFPFAGGILAATTAAAVESIPIRIDDNISVPASAAGTLWCVSLVTADGLAELKTLANAATTGLLLNVGVAVAGYAARTVTPAGAVVGTALGTVIFTCAGWQGWVLLLATFAAAVITSRVGLQRKSAMGIAEERGGRRGAGNAFANTGVAAIAALLSVLGYTAEPALIAFVAALAAGGSDTMASEIGKAWGRTAYLITSGRRVAPGTSGALSVEGTLAGLAGAAALAGLGLALSLIPLEAVLPIVVGATAGSIAESVMGATLEPRGIVNNDVLNFLNTGIAAWIAVELSRVL